MKKILITSIGGDIGYGIIKSLRNAFSNTCIIGCDIIKYNYSYDLVDKFYISPKYDNKIGWLRFIKSIIKKNKIDYLWPVSEPEIQIINDNKNEFRNVKIVINSNKILSIALDKYKTIKFLSKNKILVPKTYFDIEQVSLEFPIVLKESSGCGSHNVYIVNSYDELINKSQKMSNPIFQEYIGCNEDEYTLTIFSNKKVVNYIAFKRLLGFGGLSRYVELAHDDKLRVLAKKIASIFSLHGSINVQMRKKNNKYYIFEINPRISSTIGFRAKLGFNDVKWWVDMFEKKKIEKYIIPQKNIYGVKGVEEKVFINN